jgi:hypothetical protein
MIVEYIVEKWVIDLGFGIDSCDIIDYVVVDSAVPEIKIRSQ